MPLLAPPFDQPTSLKDEIDRVIIDAIMDDDRSLQTTLGPSEMGCPRCIARHFLGHQKLDHTKARTADKVPWLPWVGTAMHSQLEATFTAENERLVAEGFPPRWELEKRVPVGIIDGRYLSGSTDAWDNYTGTVIDWKLVGKTTLDAARRKGAPGTYRKQAHIYGRGRKLLGYDVRHVAIYFLPRNAIRLSDGVFWTEPFNPELAEEAVATVQKIAALTTQIRGDKDAEVSLLQRLEADAHCFSCDEYEPLPGILTPSKDGRAAHADFDQPTPFSRR